MAERLTQKRGLFGRWYPFKPPSSSVCSSAPSAVFHRRTVQSRAQVAARFFASDTSLIEPVWLLSKRVKACVGTLSAPRVPSSTADAIRKLSGEAAREVGRAQCSASSRKSSSRAGGHTRTRPSSDAVARKALLMSMSLMQRVCRDTRLSSLREAQLAMSASPLAVAKTTRRCSSSSRIALKEKAMHVKRCCT
jgi:hypothetical protein